MGSHQEPSSTSDRRDRELTADQFAKVCQALANGATLAMDTGDLHVIDEAVQALGLVREIVPVDEVSEYLTGQHA